MIIGKVTGSIVSTRKNENLVGHKLLIVKPLSCMKSASEGETFVAIDNVGAGIGGFVTFTENVHALLEKGPRKVSPHFIPKMIGNIACGQILNKDKSSVSQ